MIYKKEQDLLKHYNKYPAGGTTIKDKQIIRVIFEIAGVKPASDSIVLDLGCASGVMASNIQKLYNCTMIGVDFASSRIGIGEKKRPEVKYICMDMHQFLEQTESKFDFIMLFDTLEHMENPARLIEEAKEVLTPAGKIISKTPLNFPYKAHLQVFASLEDFNKRLEPTRSFEYDQSVIALWE